MSEIAISRASRTADLFRPLTVALLLIVGTMGFAGMLVTSAYAPDLRLGGNGGGHALSDASIGFGGVVRLAGATGRNPHIIRDLRVATGDGLLVATPESGFVNLSPLLGRRGHRPTLLVMPKWKAVKDPDHPGWVRIGGLLAIGDPQYLLAPGLSYTVERRRSGSRVVIAATGVPAEIRFTAPVIRQVITGATDAKKNAAPFEPLLTDGDGGILLGRIGRQNLFVLADPDLLDNFGLRTPDTARSALRLLDGLNTPGARTIDFDVTLNGLGGSHRPIRLAFEPPFVAATAAIAVVLLLLGVQAFARFGAAVPPERAIAFGKVALVDNSAALVRKARRAHRLGGAYANLVRERAAHAFGVPLRLDAAATDRALDALGHGARFTDLTAAARDAGNGIELLAAAQALHQWRREKVL